MVFLFEFWRERLVRAYEDSGGLTITAERERERECKKRETAPGNCYLWGGRVTVTNEKERKRLGSFKEMLCLS